MSLSIDWGTKVITVPQSYLNPLGGVYYEMNVDDFRLDLKDIEDSEEGIPHTDTHRHNTEVTIGGITLARTFEIINGYTVTFEDGAYAVTLKGANNNIIDALNFNNVSVASTNSTGLITVVSGSGVTQQDKEDIAVEVWQHTAGAEVSTDLNNPDQYKADVSALALESSVQTVQSDLDDPTQYQADLTNLITLTEAITKMLTNRLKIDENANTMTIYEDNGITPYVVFDLKNKAGAPASEGVYERVPQ